MSNTHKQTRVVVATSLGNCLEIFDFTVYSFFAVIIGKLYFPSSNEYSSWFMALGTFGLGFVMRPLGSLIIGNYADRVGRRTALTLTISLMTIGTGIIAFSPTYQQIGIAAPILLIIGRLIQGFSAGGEFGAATTYLMESASTKNRAFIVSWQNASQGLATLLGATFAAILIGNLTDAQLQSWGWRVPFIFGLIIAPVGLYIRRQLDETFTYKQRKTSALAELLKSHKRTVITGIFMLMGGVVSNYTMMFFLPSYLNKTLNMPADMAQYSSIIGGATTAVMAPLFGLLADRFPNRKKYLIITTFLSYIYIYPAFLLITTYPSVEVVMMMAFIKAVLGSTGSAVFFLIMMESFPAKARVSGLAVIYATGAAIFGGTAQLTLAWLLQLNHNDPMTPAWYMLFCSTISFIALLSLKVRKATDA